MNRTQSRVAIAIGGVATALALTNVGLMLSNRSERAEIAERAWFVADTEALRPLFGDMVEATMKMATRLNDPVLGKLLERLALKSPPPAPVSSDTPAQAESK